MKVLDRSTLTLGSANAQPLSLPAEIISSMRVRFWGTRGSLPKPGPDTLRFGGNTSCVEVQTDSGTRVIIDCGSGLHGLGQALLGAG